MWIRNKLSHQFVDIPVACFNIFMWLFPPSPWLFLVGGDTENNEQGACSGYLKQNEKQGRGEKRLGFFKRSLGELETSGILGTAYSVLWEDPEKSHPHDAGRACKGLGMHCQLGAFGWTSKAFVSCPSQPPLPLDSNWSCPKSGIPVSWNKMSSWFSICFCSRWGREVQVFFTEWKFLWKWVRNTGLKWRI